MLRNNYSGLRKKKFLPEKFFGGKFFESGKIPRRWWRAGKKGSQRTATERVPVLSGVAIRSQSTTHGRFYVGVKVKAVALGRKWSHEVGAARTDRWQLCTLTSGTRSVPVPG